MLVSNTLPYAKPLLTIAFKRCCCCCKRKNYKVIKSLNPEFPLERRYGTMLATVYTALTYGFAIPTLLMVATSVFVFQYVVDKLLISFYYKERVMHNDILNRSCLRILKYSFVIFFYFAADSMKSNYCSIHNNITDKLLYTNEKFMCTGIFNEVYFMWACAGVTLSVFVISEFVFDR